MPTIQEAAAAQRVASLARVRELLARYVGPQWPRAALLAALLFGSIGVQLFNP
jgi:hypothetical protein